MTGIEVHIFWDNMLSQKLRKIRPIPRNADNFLITGINYLITQVKAKENTIKIND